MQIIGFIHAKAHSSRLNGKHLKLIGGVPLIERVIDAALDAQGLDEVILSTDCEDMIDIGKARGVDVWKRQPPYNSDEVTGVEVMLNDWQTWKERNRSVDSWAMDLMGNTLLLNPALIDEVIDAARVRQGANRVVAVMRAEHHWPGFCRYFRDGSEVRPVMDYALIPTVHMPAPYYEMGAPNLLLSERTHGGIQIGVPMEPFDAVHVHTQDDMDLAEWLWTRKKTPSS